MGLAKRLKDKYIAQLDELINAGASMPMRQHSRVVAASYITGEMQYRHFDLASYPEFVEWRTSCIAVLDQMVPGDSLLRKTVDSLHTLSQEPSKVEFATAFLRSVRRELERGSLDSLALQVEATVLTDYMEQAAALLAENGEELTHVPAAVLAGASLERSLRTLCEDLEPQEAVKNDRGEFLGMGALIDGLKRRQVFNELQAKQLRAWAAIRNSAAHGKFDEFTSHQVKQMLEGISEFLTRHVR